MSVESATERLQIIAKEKEMQRSEHKRRLEEETKLLERKEVKDELKRA
jgi:hypothetical protein